MHNIDDYFSRGDGPIYSWINLQDDGIRVLARLDRFYSFSDLAKTHLPILCKIRSLEIQHFLTTARFLFLLILVLAHGWLLLEG